MSALLGIFGSLLGTLGSFAGLGSIPYIGPLLAFFSSGAGRLVGIGMIVVLAYGYGFFKGDARADAKCADAAAKAELAAARQDLEAERKARLEDQSALEELRKKDGDNAVALKKLQDDLAKRPASTRCQWGG